MKRYMIETKFETESGGFGETMTFVEAKNESSAQAKADKIVEGVGPVKEGAKVDVTITEVDENGQPIE